MLKEIKNAVVALLMLSIITGVAYPLFVTLIAQFAFENKANGSLLPGNQGSSLIGQAFDDPKYFWGRLSGCGYNAAASSGTNYAMTNPALIDAAKTRIAALKSADPSNDRSIPVDLVTASASGLDPNISIEAAKYQSARIARVRGVSTESIIELINGAAEYPIGGILGEPRVNVLRLNLTLDGKMKSPAYAGMHGNADGFETTREKGFLPN